MIESADNCEQSVDATFIFYPFPEKHKENIVESALQCSNQKDINKDCTGTLEMDGINLNGKW